MREESELALAAVVTGDIPGSAGPFNEVPATTFGIAGGAAVFHVGSASVARDVVTCIDMAARAPAGTGGITLEGTVPHPDGNVPCLLGEGQLPLLQCLQALVRIGYDGWFCLETEKRWHAEAPDPEQSIPQFAQFMKQNWPSDPAPPPHRADGIVAQKTQP